MKSSHFRNLCHLTVVIIILLCIDSIECWSQNLHTYLPLPGELGPWQLKDTARVFQERELFTLIDGGADIYLEYGFQRVIAAEYENPQNRSIKLEIYEMTDASAAYGMFSLNRGTQGKTIALGNEGLRYDYHVMFWKNRFLVYVSGNDTLEETSTAIATIASIVEKKLGLPGKTPLLLNKLPSNALIKSMYFRGIIGISSLYTFDTKNIFGVKEGIFGAYSTHNVFILQYNSRKDAEEIFEHAQQTLQTNKRFTYVQRSADRFILIDRNEVQSCITHFNNLIIIVQADSKKEPIGYIESVLSFLKDH